MSSCIFCHRKPPDVSLTHEHVFPEAIGGQLTLDCICKNCNDKIGHYVDTKLTENLLVRMVRLGLCIPSKKGHILTPLHDGTVKGHPNLRGTFSPTGNGSGRVTLRPVVERDVGPDGCQLVKIVAEPHEAEGILSTVRERAIRDGGDIRVVEQWQETIRKPVVVKTVRSMPTDLIRALLKIAFELGIYWLGPCYATHVSGLPIARAVTTGVVAEIEAALGYFPPDSQFRDWEIPSWYHAAKLDVVTGGIWAAFRVFNIIEARVLLVDHAKDFEGTDGRWMLLDPLTGNTEEGMGIRPLIAVEANEDTEVSWSSIGQHRFRVNVRFRGKDATTTQVELKGV